MSDFKGKLPRVQIPSVLLETKAQSKGLDSISGRTLEVTKTGRLLNRVLKVSLVFATISVLVTAFSSVPTDFVDKTKKVVIPTYSACSTFQENFNQCTNVKNKRPDQCIDHLDALRQCRAALMKPNDLSLPSAKS